MDSIYSIDDIMEHNKKNDCWIAINKDVYDITDFIEIHPGGSAMLLTVAGTDATDFFNELHRPDILEEIAIDYRIGTFSNGI